VNTNRTSALGVVIVGGLLAGVARQAAAQAPPISTSAPLQLVQPQGPAAPPQTLTLRDVLERARQYDATYQASVTDAESAAQDRAQAKNALLPGVSFLTQYLGTQGNGTTPNGRFVTNDGVHVYRSWLAVRQDFSPASLSGTTYHRAQAAEALANARREIAQRGLTVTVTRLYYALLVAQRRYSTAQQAAQQAARFLDVAQQQERVGQVAHSDVVRANIQSLQQQQAYQEAGLTIENARLELAVVISPTLNENFTLVDDLDMTVALPSFDEIQMRAVRENPDLRAATENTRIAAFDVRAARNAFLPTLTFDGVYGIEANEFALHSVAAAFPDKGVLPNLGYFFTASLNLPVWDWGTLRSKLAQANVRQRQAGVELNQTQRQLVRSLYQSYNEATAARAAVDGLRQASDLADDSLRLVGLRYQAGESTALELVDAQNTVVQARGAYGDALIRYRVAIAQLQTITGSF
jgi:outer membrane protein TolC